MIFRPGHQLQRGFGRHFNKNAIRLYCGSGFRTFPICSYHCHRFLYAIAYVYIIGSLSYIQYRIYKHIYMYTNINSVHVCERERERAVYMLLGSSTFELETYGSHIMYGAVRFFGLRMHLLVFKSTCCYLPVTSHTCARNTLFGTIRVTLSLSFSDSERDEHTEYTNESSYSIGFYCWLVW